jgi:hypothetical protein
MKKILLFIFINLLAVVAFSEEAIISLNSGRKVVLHEDYTWEYVDNINNVGLKIDNEVIYRGKLGLGNIHYDSEKWKEASPFSSTTEISFINVKGDGYVSFVEERIQVPIENMKDLVSNMLTRNGLSISQMNSIIENIENTTYLLMTINGEIKGIKVKYLYKVWSGNKGTVQLIVFTASNLFDEYLNDFKEMLNGLEICQKD